MRERGDSHCDNGHEWWRRDDGKLAIFDPLAPPQTRGCDVWVPVVVVSIVYAVCLLYRAVPTPV